MGYVGKNYMRQGGRDWRIGGSITILPGGQISFLSPRKSVYFVDSTVTASGDGLSWATAFKTIAEAVALAVAGDTIYIYSGTGTAHEFAESIAITSLAGIQFIGGGTNPDQAVWTGLAGHALTFTDSADFFVSNIRFRPANGYGGVSLVGASSYGTIFKNRLQGMSGSKYGIVSDGQQSGLKVLDNDFMYFNAATCYGIYAPIYGTTAENASWEIARNKFHGNTYHLKGNFRYSDIIENTFGGYGLLSTGAQGAPTKCLDLTPATGSVGNNQVTRNSFGGDYTTALYVSANANDDWIGNYAYHATTAPYGLTIAIPGA